MDAALDPIPEIPEAEPQAPSRWRWVGTVAGVLLGIVLLFGAFGKMIDPVGFAELLHADNLDFFIPANVLVYVALGLEIFVGLALLLGIRHTVVMVPAVFLVALFMFITGRHYVDSLAGLPPSHSCGCFGNLIERSPAEAFWQDFTLLVPTLALSFLGRSAVLPVGRLAAVGGATFVSLVFTWFAPEMPIDDFATKLRTGIEVTDICAGQDDGRICFETVIPELVEGQHLVLIADVEDPSIYPKLNEYAMAGVDPFLWVVSPLSQARVTEIREDFLWDKGIETMFEVIHAPPAVVRPLYRTLPRAFLVQGGKVIQTWAGMPPLEKWTSEAPGTDR